MGFSSGFSRSFKAGKRVRKRFSLDTSTSSVNEGEEVVITLNTKRIRGGKTVPYQITGIDSSDLASGSLSGTFSIDSSGVGTISLTLRSDSSTEGLENLSISLTNNRASRSVQVSDTSQSGPTYAISSASSVNEGSSLSVTVNTTGVANGTQLYWTISNNTSSTSDFSSQWGTLYINSNTGSFSISAISDSFTEGAETFSVSIRSGSISGTVLATSGSITINDTSTTPSPWTPSVISSDVHTWVDFGDTSNYAFDGRTNNLTSVTDKAGNVTFSFNNTPSVNVQHLNSMDVAYFDGTEYIYGNSATAAVDSSGNHYAVSLWKITGIDVNKDSIWSYDNTKSGRRDYAVSARTSSTWSGEIDMGNGTAESGTLDWSGDGYMNNWIIYAVVFDKTGNRIFARANGSDVTTRISYSSSLQNNMILKIGTNRTGNRKVQGYCAEFISIKSTPGERGTIGELEKIEGYMAHKWGISSSLNSSHPYRNSAPTT